MTKNIYKLALVTVLPVLAWSCQDDFLDAEVTRNVTQERHNELIQDSENAPKVAKAAIAKTYEVFQQSFPSRGGHDSFGLRAFQLATDMMCEDITIGGPQWFMYDYQQINNEPNYRRTHTTWGIYYSIISKINLHLETFFAKESKEPAILAAKGEALAIRGIAYFYLVNFYQHTYKGHEKDLGVPLTLKSTDSNLPRATVQEVYDQIIKDLTFAVEHATETGEHTDVDRSVAAAYLAKVYAQMEDWQNVEKYADIAIKGGADIVSAPGRSWSIGEGDILWGYDVNAQTSTLWASFWSHMDQMLPRGYAAGGDHKMIHNLLYDKIPVNDSRRKLWVNNTDFPEVAKQLKSTSPNETLEMNDFDQLKFVAGNAQLEQDYCFLRVQDPILLKIEAEAELGNVAGAKTLLEEFVKKRNPDFVAPSGKDELIEEIRFQRRIELWGEGTNWLDMKRWKLPIDRTGTGTNHWQKNLINTDDNNFYHKIPQGEIEANPNLVQNK